MFETTMLETTGNLQMFSFKGIMHLWTVNIVFVRELVWEDIERINGRWKLLDSYYRGFFFFFFFYYVELNSLERNDDEASPKSMGKEAEI